MDPSPQEERARLRLTLAYEQARAVGYRAGGPEMAELEAAERAYALVRGRTDAPERPGQQEGRSSA